MEATGQDRVGAVQLLPPDAEPGGYRKTEAVPMAEADVAHVLRNATLPGSGLLGEGRTDFGTSVGGAQEKTALTLVDGNWYLPKGATPTKCIFKLSLGPVGARKADMRTSVENERLRAQFQRLCGIPVAETAMAAFEDKKALVVTRFERQAMPEG